VRKIGKLQEDTGRILLQHFTTYPGKLNKVKIMWISFYTDKKVYG